jgi:hypothetical protein
MFREEFLIVARETQKNLVEILDEQVGWVEADLKMLSDENTILESERDLQFRKRVEEVVDRAKREVERLGQVVGVNE